jgi:hypothetical protein
MTQEKRHGMRVALIYVPSGTRINDEGTIAYHCGYGYYMRVIINDVASHNKVEMTYLDGLGVMHSIKVEEVFK